MTTTNQRIMDAEDGSADRVMRVGSCSDGLVEEFSIPRTSAGTEPSAPDAPAEAATASVVARGADRREPPEAAEAVAREWRHELAAAVEEAPAGHPHPVIAAMATCLEALDGVREAGVATLTAREIRLMLLAVVQVVTAAFALKLRLVAAGEARRIADLTGATSTAAFLAHLTRSNRPDATSEVRLARDLDVKYHLLAAALAEGRISREQVRECVTGLRRLPPDLPVDQLQACERFLVDAAETMTPKQLRIVGRKLWEVIDPDGADAKDGEALEDEERLARAKAYLRSWRNGDGTTGFRGKLPDAQADMLLKLLHALAAPRRRKNPAIPTGQPDNACPDNAQPDNAQPDNARPNHAGTSAGSQGTPCDGSPADPCLDEESAEEEATGKTVPYPVRLGHALMDLLERIPARAVPDSAGAAASIVVTVGEEQLRTGVGVATLDTGTPVSAGQVRRLACAAGLIPMVLDGHSEPLDVGREQRLHTRYQRLAAAHRQDGACGITGCDRPIADYHHPVPWSSGGDTSLANCLGLCGYHHHLAHHPGWLLTHDAGVWILRRLPDH